MGPFSRDPQGSAWERAPLRGAAKPDRRTSHPKVPAAGIDRLRRRLLLLLLTGLARQNQPALVIDLARPSGVLAKLTHQRCVELRPMFRQEVSGPKLLVLEPADLRAGFLVGVEEFLVLLRIVEPHVVPLVQ